MLSQLMRPTPALISISWGRTTEAAYKKVILEYQQSERSGFQNEPDENQQPNFNLSMIDCERQIDESGKSTGLKCKVTQQ